MDEKKEPPKKNDITIDEADDTPEKLVTSHGTRNVGGGEDFWDLGSPSERKYEKPSFSPDSLSVTDVSVDVSATDVSVDVSVTDVSVNTAGGETIPKKNDAYYPSQTMNPFTSIPPKNYVTHSYKRPRPAQRTVPADEIKRREPEKPAVYEKNGALISKITVDGWSGENDFYTRFALDAEKSHTASPKTSPDTPMRPAQFFSLVPQYSHMSGQQTEYYRRLRDKWRAGEYPDCDSAYIMLYIFELLNLSSVTKDYVLSSLSSVWIGYRGRLARLDSYLCEWTADYCMINDMPFPDAMRPYLSEIAAKAHFKEYYFDYLLSHTDFESAAHALIYCFSDYVYSSSKYYGENREQYEKYIPQAVSAVLKRGTEKKFGIFALEKKYKIVIDTFLGCAVSSAKKKKLTVEFRSFLRGIETREYVTALVKYSENTLRKCLGIKAKLGVKELDGETIAAVNEFFTPLLPEDKAHMPPEEKYMPRDYLKNYEAESSGFDLETAAQIERASWTNTARLTAEDECTAYENSCENSFDDDLGDASSDASFVEGQISADDVIAGDVVTDDVITNDVIVNDSSDLTSPDTDFIRAGVAAALDGRFRRWAKESGVYEGEAQDVINTYFLEITGDIILEDFTLIEDYREDVEEWMK